MSEKPLFDFAKLQELDKQKQGQNEQLNTLLDQNDLIRKKIPDGPNSLLRAISDALYSTTHYADEIKQFLFKHLTHLIASDKLPTRLAMFRGNTMLLKDYTSNPHMSGFDKINIELVSSQFKVKIVVYSISEDGYLSSIIVNNHYERTIEIVRAKNNHYEPVYSKLYMQKLGVAQNIVLNIIEKALNKDSNLPFKNLNEDSYLNFEYLNWLSSLGSDTSLSQFRITRGKHKKSVSDSFGKVFEPTEGNQMKLYGMFTNTKPPEDFLKLLRQRKDTAESNFSINADFDFMDEPWHETPTNPAKTPVPATSSTSTSFRPNANKDSDISSSKATPQTTSGVYFRDNVNFSEEAKNERTPVRDVSGISPVHFMNTPPPGLTPSRYPQKSFTYVEVGGHPGMTAEGLSPSPTFTRPESVQTAGNIYGQATPTRPGFSSGFTQAYKGNSPLPRQGSGLYQNRTGNSETLTLSVQSSEGMMQDGAGFDQGVLSASKEKKKPIILDESKERYTGRLKFFDETKNYGFIIMDGDGSDIFVHMDDLMKANITKDMLKDTKNGIILRLAFSCMKYIGKYQKSRKATDIELLP